MYSGVFFFANIKKGFELKGERQRVKAKGERRIKAVEGLVNIQTILE
jgi:hypothetical protein